MKLSILPQRMVYFLGALQGNGETMDIENGDFDMRVYYDRDCDINLIKDKKVAILGYGSKATPTR